MKKIGLIVKTTLTDSSCPPYDHKEIKICDSISNGKNVVLDELKHEFYDENADDDDKLLDCKTLDEIASLMSTWGYDSVFCDENTFSWEDNCKGETYRFVEIDIEDYANYQSI
jgi:hypothetical protein